VNTSLSYCATSDRHLTLLSTSTQDPLVGKSESDDSDQWGSFQQETIPGPLDPSITTVMHIRRRDTSNVSKIAIAETATASFLESIDSHLTFSKPVGPCLGRARITSRDNVSKTGFACVDSGATHHMSNGKADDFADYKVLPKGSHVLVADNHPIECLGIGTQFLRIDGRTIGRRQVLHVPALKAPLISVRQHRRNQGCSFIADNNGCYLTFPTFSIIVDDSSDCLLAYEIINPKGMNISKCDYMQNEPDRIEKLALTETRRFDDERKSRSPLQSSPNKSENKQGVAWKVETRASLRRKQEQATKQAASQEQLNKVRIEVSRLEDEAKATHQKLLSARPEVPITSEEKQEIIQSLINSFEENKDSIDYKLIKNIEKRFPRPPFSPNDIAQEDSDSAPIHSTETPVTPTTTTPADRPNSLPCDKPPSASPNVQ
jgi:hypothetical protein